MKCPHCGAPLKMEEKFCTYCGAPNRLAMKHQADMEHYEREFAETQEEVLTKSRKAGSLAGFLVVLIIMIVLNIVAAFFCANAWNIKYDRRQQAVARRADEYKAELDRMIEEQDYISIRSYYYNNNLTGCDEFEEYSAVMRYSGHLGDLYGQLMDLDMFEYRFSADRIDSTISMMSEDLIGIYEDTRNGYYRDEAVTPEKLAVIEDIRRQTEGLLIAYAGFSAEEVRELQNMSRTRIEKTLLEHLSREAEVRKEDESESAESYSISELLEMMGGDDT